MTSPLRRKRPTTARGRSIPATTPARLAAAGLLLLAGGLARAQELPPPLPVPTGPVPAASARPAPLPSLPAASPFPAPPVKKITFHKAEGPARPVSPAAAEIRQAQFAGGRTAPGVGTDQMDYLFQLLPAGFPRLTSQLKSEDALREQIRQEFREKSPPERATFPEEKPVTGTRYADHVFAPQVALAEPYYVNYKRLYFQDLNSERYGWELGFVQPLVSTGLFFTDLALLPYHCASRPLDCVQSSAGYCLPGDPVPYLCYPPHLSVTGSVAEAAAVIAVLAIFP
jgi:hypothetical protein